MTEANALVKLLQEKKLTLALAESITCGQAAFKLSTAKGVSDVLMGSVVCYSPDVKCDLLKVSQSLIKKHTAESMEATEALARNLSKLIKADIYAAVTGLANAGGSETKTKPVGTIFISVRFKRQILNVRKVFRGSPSDIKEKASIEIFKTVTAIVKK